MSKKIKKILIIFGTIISIWLTFFITDVVRVNKDKKPIFAVKVVSYDDGGSVKYMGLFYNVYHIKKFTIINEEVEIVDYGYHMKPWFVSIDDVKESVI